ncbi:hypothetical protein [Citrobacter portucalensis]|uniref:hypothetical protein n=1 Tax=Citrobacter portucalensis TaxID=1639133 RepID=UPI002B245143|nr:hypothetical protein [Citrobacter portucalensis]MEB1054314.1 hypothetical protein [Citrobacter portucalensis]
MINPAREACFLTTHGAPIAEVRICNVCTLSSDVVKPLWGGLAVNELVPGASSAPRGSVIKRATTLSQLVGFSVFIGTTNALGGNSIVLGDNDTGFKQNGDGILDVHANSVHVFRFLPGSVESAVPLKVGGSEVATQAWVLQNFVQNIRVSASQERKFWDGAGWSGNDSAFATAIWMVGGSSNVGGLLVRYVQKLINNTWYNVTE